ncbi:MAG: prolyl oligopeptidase family serine peptidase [Caldithrix sp.]|nr:prolyl oligopeptidase family serine peptidase [Caldithrix sp.]
MKRLIVFHLVILTSVSLLSAQKAITFDDFFAMQRLGDVAVQPGGQHIAYSLTTPHIKANTLKTDIWILDREKGQTRQLTDHEKSSSGPVWSSDGTHIFFNRDGQIWRQSLESSQAEKITDIATGASGPVLNQAGSKMLFVSRIYPECETLQCSEEKLKAENKSKVKARVIDHLMYRHWNRWREGRIKHVLMADTDGQNIRDVTPGPYDAPPVGLGSGNDYTFSPDGQEICFVRNTDEIVAASTNNDLFIHNLQSGKISRLTKNKGNDNNPHYSPDGRYIAFTSMARAGFEADRYRIMLYDRQSKSIKELTEDFPLSASSIVWQPDGQSIFFTVSEQDHINLYKIDIATGRIRSVLKGHYIHNVQFLNDHTLIFAKESARMPREIFSYNLKNQKLQQLTQINTERLSQLELPSYEEFWFTGANGDKVQGFILKPPFFDPDKKYPAIELIHGGPQGAWGDDFHYRWNYQMFASPGYVVFFINFHGSRGYGQTFTDAVTKDWGGAPYEDILKGTSYVLQNYDFIDKNRLGAAGASYGGFMINWIAGDDHPFQCLVSHDGVYEQVSMYGATEELWFPEWEFNGKPWENQSLYQKWNPANRADRFKTPMLVIHGEHDYRVPYTQGLQLFTALQRQGVPSKLLFFPDENHFVQKPQNARLWWKTVHHWFEKYLQ